MASSKPVSKNSEESSEPKAKIAKAGDAPEDSDFLSIEKFETMMKTTEADIAPIQSNISKIEEEFQSAVRKIEAEFFEKKKEFYKQRSDIITTKHKEFWPHLLLNHPKVELFLSIGAKNPTVQEADVMMCRAITDVDYNVKTKGEKACHSMTIKFDPENEYIENSYLTRTVKHSGVDPSEDESAIIETTQLKPKPKLQKIIDQFSNKSPKQNGQEKKSEKDGDEQDDIDVMSILDTFKVPFVTQYCDKSFQIMNDFVLSMKSVFESPIEDLRVSLENEDNDADFDDSDSDDDEDDDENDEPLESIEEEPEE